MLKSLVLVLIFLLSLVVVFYLGFCFLATSQLVQADHTPVNILPSVIGTESENIQITTKDNLKLKGWLFKSSSNKLIIMVSGLRENRANNSYHGFIIAKELINLGYNVLLYDNRGTGESEGKIITFGQKESQDLLSVVDFAKQKGFEDKNIGIIGNSMGASALLLDSDKLKHIGAMVVDSPAKDIKGVVSNILQNENHVYSFFHPTIFFILKTIYGVDVNSIQPALHVKNSPQRVFLYLHGELDTSTYPTESKYLLEISNPKSKLVIFKNAGHIQTYISNPELYRKTVYTFLKDNLGK